MEKRRNYLLKIAVAVLCAFNLYMPSLGNMKRMANYAKKGAFGLVGVVMIRDSVIILRNMHEIRKKEKLRAKIDEYLEESKRINEVLETLEIVKRSVEGNQENSNELGERALVLDGESGNMSEITRELTEQLTAMADKIQNEEKK